MKKKIKLNLVMKKKKMKLNLVIIRNQVYQKKMNQNLIYQKTTHKMMTNLKKSLFKIKTMRSVVLNKRKNRMNKNRNTQIKKMKRMKRMSRRKKILILRNLAAQKKKIQIPLILNFMNIVQDKLERKLKNTSKKTTKNSLISLLSLISLYKMQNQIVIVCFVQFQIS